MSTSNGESELVILVGRLGSVSVLDKVSGYSPVMLS